jgi:hypothetical protein
VLARSQRLGAAALNRSVSYISGLIGSVSVAHGMMGKLAHSYQELNDIGREWDVTACTGEVCIDQVFE